MSWSFSAFIIPSTLKRFSVTLSEMHPQTVTEPPRVSQMAVDCHCWTSLLDASLHIYHNFNQKCQILDSPLHQTWVSVQFLCELAYLSLLPVSPSLSFSTGTFELRPFLMSLQGTVKAQMHLSCINSLMDFLLFLKDLTFTPCPLLPFFCLLLIQFPQIYHAEICKHFQLEDLWESPCWCTICGKDKCKKAFFT